MAESVRVICRCRPLNQRELRLNSQVCVEMDPAIGQCVLKNGDENLPKVFTFDGVYYMDSTAEHIYNDIVYPLVESVIEGYNGTVFAYGQTGSGKTFSMLGEDQHRGIIPRTFEHIFETIATTEHTKFLVHVSYLEIYNEEIRDLLSGKERVKLEIKEHPDHGVYVYGLTMHVCHTVAHCEELMNIGFNNRHVGATLMNKDSSRSHAIFTIYVEALAENGSIRMGKLHLVDLAGSERQAKTGATGERFKEATKINLSLSALGNVISALVDGKSKHIPYRDSKLTRLLQDSLGGNTKTVMIACISPSDNNFDETLSTLRYAKRAKNIKNKPTINEDPKDALLREYREEIQRLKMLVQQPESSVVTASSGEEMEREKKKLRAEFELAMGELRASYEKEQKSKAKLQQDLESLKEEYEKAAKNIGEPPTKSKQFQSQTSESGGVVVVSGGILDEEKDAQKRIELLEQQMVGGEQANNEALKQKRLKKIREAERKMKLLADALKVNKYDPLLHVYTSTQDKLDALIRQYNLELQKNKLLESEIHDLQGEFELDRLDYLETIRKQDQQLKLYQQFLEKLQPLIRRECNYSSIEEIRRDASWNEDQLRWILPEVVLARGPQSAASRGRDELLGGGGANGGPGSGSYGIGAGGNATETLPVMAQPQGSARGESTDEYDSSYGYMDEQDSKLKQKLEQSNDFVKNYFKQVSTSHILDKYNSDRHKAQAKEKLSNFVKRNQPASTDTDDGSYYSLQDSATNDAYARASRSLGARARATSATRKNPPPRQRLEALPRDDVTRNRSFM